MATTDQKLELEPLMPKDQQQENGQEHALPQQQQQQQTGQQQHQSEPKSGKQHQSHPHMGQQQHQSQPQKGLQQPPPLPEAGQQQPPPLPEAGQQQPPPQPEAGQQQPPPQPEARQQQPPPQPEAGQQQPPPQPEAGQQQPPPQPEAGQQQPPPQPEAGQQQPQPQPQPQLLQKTECKDYVPDPRDLKVGVNGTTWLCVCGRGIAQHDKQPTTGNTAKFIRQEKATDEKLVNRLLKAKRVCIGELKPLQDFGGDIHFTRRNLIAKKSADKVKFQRLADDNKMPDVVEVVLRGSWQLDELLESTWQNQECGSLAISVCGDLATRRKRPALYKLIGDSVVKAATVVNGLIVTPGMTGSIARAIGHSLEETKHWQKVRMSQGENKEKVIPCVFCVGITAWNMVQNNECLTPNQSCFEYSDFSEDDSTSKNCLNSCHTHFLLFDDGTLKPNNPRYQETIAKLTVEFIYQLEQTKMVANKDQPIIPIQILVGGQDSVNIRSMNEALKKRIPVVLCYGTGGVTDVIVKAHNMWNSGAARNLFQETCKQLLKEIEFKSGDTEASEASRQICKTFTDDPHGFNIFVICDLRAGEEEDIDGAERELDSAILKAMLMKTKRHNTHPTEAKVGELSRLRSEYVTQLKLAIHWRKFELADELIFPKLTSLITGKHSGHPEIAELKKNLKGILKECLVKDLSEFVDALLVMDEESLLTTGVIGELFRSEPKKDPLKDIFDRNKFEPGHADAVIRQHVTAIMDTLMLHNEQYCLSETAPDYKGVLIGAVFAQSWQVVHFLLRLIATESADALTSTLAVAYLCKTIGGKQWDNDIKSSYKEKAEHFERLSIEMLEYLRRTHPGDLSTELVERSQLWSPLTPKKIAEEGNFKNLLSSEPLNAEVRVEWNGQSCKRASKCGGPQFTPKAKFYSHMVGFLAMLLVWTSFLVWGFIHERVGAFEICVILWTFSYWIGRCRSWYYTLKRSGVPLLFQLKSGRHLRCLEVIMVLGFLIAGLTCHLAGESEGSKVLYCTLCCLLIVRLVHFMKAFRFFSTQISIIFHVASNVLSFLCFTLVLIWSAGIMLSSLLCVNTSAEIVQAQSNETNPVRLIGEASLQNLVDLAWYLYLALYGEFTFSLSADEDLACVARKSAVQYTVYVLLGTYILIGNVLLLNLLVSMFESVSQSVSASANAIWKRNWYILLQRYKHETILPPPFNVVGYVIAAIRPGEVDRASSGTSEYRKKIHMELAKLLVPEEQTSP